MFITTEKQKYIPLFQEKKPNSLTKQIQDKADAICITNKVQLLNQEIENLQKVVNKVYQTLNVRTLKQFEEKTTQLNIDNDTIILELEQKQKQLRELEETNLLLQKKKDKLLVDRQNVFQVIDSHNQYSLVKDSHIQNSQAKQVNVQRQIMTRNYERIRELRQQLMKLQKLLGFQE